MLEQFCFFGFLVLWFFVFLVLWFFGFLVVGSLVLWFFVFLVVWFYCGEGYISKQHKKPKKQKNKEPKKTKKQKPKKNKKPKKQRTKKPKNQKTKNQNCSSILRGALVFWFFWFRSLGGSSRTRSEGSNSIPRKKHEHASGSDVLKGTVCHGGGGGGDHIYIYRERERD